MKKQTGVSIDAQVWDAYRDACSREKLRLAEPMEEFLRLVVTKGSALAVMNMMRESGKAGPEGFEAYARVLLNWYRNGIALIHVTDDSEAPVESMLLQALKGVADPQLRRDIQDALMVRPGKQRGQRGKIEKSTVTETPAAIDESAVEPEVSVASRIENIKTQVSGLHLDAGSAQEMLNNIHQIREKLKSGGKGRKRKTLAKK